MDKIGRKRTLLITELPLIVGWLIVAFANNMEMICAGRLLLGLGSGMVGAPARVYTSEVTQPHLRGMLTALASIGISVGVLLQYIFGSFLAWNVLAGVSTTIGISAFISMVFLPETPNYMITKSKKDKAVKYMGRLRGSTYNVQREVNVLEDFAVKNQIQQ
jgi:facilitated trehalose transporter